MRLRPMPCVGVWACLALVVSCATDITSRGRQVALVEIQADEVYELQNEIRIDLVSGRVRKPLAAGSHWRVVGTIDEGTVYKPLDYLLQVHTGHSYEAYLVCAEGQILGVYLPVEDSFVGLEESVPVALEVNEVELTR